MIHIVSSKIFFGIVEFRDGVSIPEGDQMQAQLHLKSKLP